MTQESHRPNINNGSATKKGQSSSNKNGARFEHFVLQGHYRGIAGWEDLTAEDSLDQILERQAEYLMDDSAARLRIVSVWIHPTTGKETTYVVKQSREHLD